MFGWLNLTDLNNMERLRLRRRNGGGEDKAGLDEKVRLPDVSRVLTPSLRGNDISAHVSL